MTNDTTTVAGALQEVINRLEDNLAAKGVTASFDSTTGVVGLVDEISNIEQSKVQGPLNLKVVLYGNSFASYNSTPFTFTGTLDVDWGDGNTTTYTGGSLNHTYSSNGFHCITVKGNITQIQQFLKSKTNIASVEIPNGVTYLNGTFNSSSVSSISLPNTLTSIGYSTFQSNNSLTSISIPSTVTNIAPYNFTRCPNLNDYQLYWDNPPVTYSSSTMMQENTNTYYTIPKGTTDNYIAKSFPSDKLIERS